MKLCSVLGGSLDGRGWGRMDMCVWLSPFPVHLKLSQLCQLAKPQYIVQS